MNILLKFLSLEAIDNCITCLNYDIDEVIFFGYDYIILEEKKNIKNFLDKYCKSKSTFINISNLKVNEVIEVIENNIKDNNNYYIDLTGADGLSSVALNRVGYKLNILMHIYDLKNNVFLNIDDDLGSLLSGLKLNKKEIGIKEYIEMVGGCIREFEIKANKEATDIYMNKLTDVKNRHTNNWMEFVSTIQLFRNNYKDEKHVYSLNIFNDLKLPLDKFVEIMKDLVKEGLIKNIINEDKRFEFDYISTNIKQTIKEAGSILENEVYKIEKKISDDVMVGVPLDWDGVISNDNVDVSNEIDVLSLKGYELTFISCKDTRALDNSYLYQLETVTRRFGSNYSKMILVTTCEYKENIKKRAELIGIELLTFDEYKAKYDKGGY